MKFIVSFIKAFGLAFCYIMGIIAMPVAFVGLPLLFVSWPAFVWEPSTKILIFCVINFILFYILLLTIIIYFAEFYKKENPKVKDMVKRWKHDWKNV